MSDYPAVARTSGPGTTIYRRDRIGICTKGLSSQESKKEDEEGLVKFPEAFGKETSWRTFKKVLRNYLGTKQGINEVPLEYIMRHVDGPGQVGQINATEHVHLVVTTSLKGEAFEADNGKVWSVLKICCQEDQVTHTSVI